MGWEYAICPGTIAGDFEESSHYFHNYNYEEIKEHLENILDLLNEINPGLKVILTVSPVPLTATYSNNHILSANTFSKSILRAVAGNIADLYNHVEYFPSFELISSFSFVPNNYEENCRNVSKASVQTVITHFLGGCEWIPKNNKNEIIVNEETIYCEESFLDAFIKSNEKSIIGDRTGPSNKTCIIGNSHVLADEAWF